MSLDGADREMLIRAVLNRLGLGAESSGLIPGLLPDVEIKRLSENSKRPMITPFSDKLSGEGVISHGCSSFGYDATLGTSFKLFTNSRNEVIDPKNFSAKCYDEFEEDECFIMPPHSFVLCHTLEYFKMPIDVLSICLGKSTYARCGLIVNVTPLEPGWEGQVTIEISNTTPNPAKIYPLEGICQFLFLRSGAPCETSYDARGGKYMGQQGVVDPKILAYSE